MLFVFYMARIAETIMKVWLVTGSWDYEPEDEWRLFSSEENANGWIAKQKKHKFYSYEIHDPIIIDDEEESIGKGRIFY